MKIAKRIILFISTNIAIVALVSFLIFILEGVFWIKISPNARWGIVPLAIFSLIYWFTWAFISLLISRWIAKRTYGIEIIDQSSIANYSKKIQFLFYKVHEFSLKKAISMPEFWIYESEDPNAFATWPSKNKSLIAISTWLLETLDEKELEWVIAHEMAHIWNGDMVTMTLVQWVINAFVIFLARIMATVIDYFINKEEKESTFAYHLIVMLLEVILSILASIIVMAYSRKREFSADRDSSIFTSKNNMIAALKKIKTLQERTNTFWDSELNTFKISSKKSLLKLFSSHPDIDDRINKLEGGVINNLNNL